MKLARITNKIVLYFYYLLKFRSPGVAYNFSNYNLPLKHSHSLKPDGNLIVSSATGNKISKASVHKFRFEYIKLSNILSDSRIRVLSENEESFVVNVRGIKLTVNSVSNLITLFELYIETLYDISANETDIVVIDIGMNVGYGSLFFSSLPFVEKVYSYEPFPKTFQEALTNYDLNEELKKKIIPHCAGISDYNGKISVPQMESGDGGASINKEILKVNGTENLQPVDVEVKDIVEELKRIAGENPSKKLVVKIDCEGEEYPIFERLDGSGNIGAITIFIIEWHLKGPAPILDKLNKWGYRSLSLPKSDYSSGMIYAFK